MNIKMVRKPQEVGDDGKPKKQEITKLAIGVPGGLDAEQDKYETKVAVGCYLCKIDSLSLNNPKA